MKCNTASAWKRDWIEFMIKEVSENDYLNLESNNKVCFTTKSTLTLPLFKDLTISMELRNGLFALASNS